MILERKIIQMGFLSVCALGLIVSHMNCSGSLNTPDAASQNADSDLISSSCTLANSSLRAPASIDEVVTLINQLPKPLTLNCLLQNLQPPLRIVAVDNKNSAQPSAGPDSPRLFIIRYPLMMSVVPAGEGKKLMEFSQIESSSSSVKGELEFPITNPLAPDAPYTRIISDGGGGTNCRSCHFNESKAVSGYDGEAYASNIIHSNSAKEVYLGQLQNLATSCNAIAEPYRCAILKAVIINGQAISGNFP